MEKKDRFFEVLLVIWFVFVFLIYAKLYIATKVVENLPQITSIFK
jgi:hypothetical protein